MTLPDATAIGLAGDFITAVWSEFTLFGTILAMAAALVVGPKVIKVVRSALR